VDTRRKSLKTNHLLKGKQDCHIGSWLCGADCRNYLGDALGKDHDISLINRNEFSSLVAAWVCTGIGYMKDE